MTDSAELIAQARKMYDRIADDTTSLPRDELSAALLASLADALDEQKTWLDQCRERLEDAEAKNRRLRIDRDFYRDQLRTLAQAIDRIARPPS